MSIPAGYDEAKRYEDGVLKATGQALARKMPNFYGKITFNLQGGAFKSGQLATEHDGTSVERSVR